MAIKVFAPAKINLSLHVTGQRSDGFHLLDSLVAFAPVGDMLQIEHADTLSLRVQGPEAAGIPADIDNLVLKVAQRFAKGRGAAITLTKNLPVASGIGGGSADAAAAFRGVTALWSLGQELDKDQTALGQVATDILALGADIPMCLMSQPVRVRGIGEDITPVSPLGPIPALLVNPRVQVSTPSVFKSLACKENAPMPPALPKFKGVADFTDWLRTQRNDLQAPAIAAQPAIANVLQALDQTQAVMLTRMSGSGATCFAIYPNQDMVEKAAAKLHAAHPDWWIAGGYLGDQFQLAAPEIS